MTDKKVFCKDCRWLRWIDDLPIKGKITRFPTDHCIIVPYICPIRGESLEDGSYRECHVANCHFNCPDFEPKEARDEVDT